MLNFRQDEAARRVKGWQTEGEEEGAAWCQEENTRWGRSRKAGRGSGRRAGRQGGAVNQLYGAPSDPAVDQYGAPGNEVGNNHLPSSKLYHQDKAVFLFPGWFCWRDRIRIRGCLWRGKRTKWYEVWFSKLGWPLWGGLSGRACARGLLMITMQKLWKIISFQNMWWDLGIHVSNITGVWLWWEDLSKLLRAWIFLMQKILGHPASFTGQRNYNESLKQCSSSKCVRNCREL